MAVNPNNPNDVQESYPSPTSGIGVPDYIALSGTGVTSANNQASNKFVATISLAGASSKTLQLTAVVKDSAGTTVVSTGTINWLSYGVLTSAASYAADNPNDTPESYPAQQKYAGDCSVTSGGLVTVKQLGNYIVEAQVLAGVTSGVMDSSPNSKSTFVYGQVAIEVTL